MDPFADIAKCYESCVKLMALKKPKVGHKLAGWITFDHICKYLFNVGRSFADDSHCENIELGAVQEYVNLVELEKCWSFLFKV